MLSSWVCPQRGVQLAVQGLAIVLLDELSYELLLVVGTGVHPRDPLHLEKERRLGDHRLILSHLAIYVTLAGLELFLTTYWFAANLVWLL